MAGPMDPWRCAECGTVNDSFRSMCRKCEGRRAEVEAYEEPEAAEPEPTSGRRRTKKAPSPPPPPGEGGGRRKWPTNVAIGAGILVLGLVAFLLFQRSDDPTAKRDADAVRKAAIHADELGEGWLSPDLDVRIADRTGLSYEVANDNECAEDSALEKGQRSLARRHGRAQVVQELTHRTNTSANVSLVLTVFEDTVSPVEWNALETSDEQLECLRKSTEDAAKGAGSPNAVVTVNRVTTAVPGALAWTIEIQAGPVRSVLNLAMVVEDRVAITLSGFNGGDAPFDQALIDSLLNNVVSRIHLD